MAMVELVTARAQALRACTCLARLGCSITHGAKEGLAEWNAKEIFRSKQNTSIPLQGQSTCSSEFTVRG